jgi:lysophosphatidate acyltransferase
MTSSTFRTSSIFATSSIWLLILPILYISIFGLPKRIPDSASYALRYSGFYLAIFLASLYSLAAYIGLSMVRLNEVYTIWSAGRVLSWLGYAMTGISFHISEQDQVKLASAKQAIFVLNHQTEIDGLLLAKICPKRSLMIGKKSLKHIPVFGWGLNLLGFIFVDRNDVEQSTKALEKSMRMIHKRSASILVCPEGTRSYFTEPKLLPFKKGAFYLAIRTGLPIIPVVAENYSRLVSSTAKVFRPGKINVRGEYNTREPTWIDLTVCSTRSDAHNASHDIGDRNADESRQKQYAGNVNAVRCPKKFIIAKLIPLALQPSWKNEWRQLIDGLEDWSITSLKLKEIFFSAYIFRVI